LTQQPDFVAVERVSRWLALLAAVDMQVTTLEIDLIPAQSASFADPQSVTVHEQNQSAIAYWMPPDFGSGAHHRFDFITE
jgi:hypothetical protein